MPTSHVELSFHYGDGRAGTFVATVSAQGWEVRATLDGGEVVTRQCADWRRVELLRARLEAQLKSQLVS